MSPLQLAITEPFKQELRRSRGPQTSIVPPGCVRGQWVPGGVGGNLCRNSPSTACRANASRDKFSKNMGPVENLGPTFSKTRTNRQTTGTVAEKRRTRDSTPPLPFALRHRRSGTAAGRAGVCPAETPHVSQPRPDSTPRSECHTVTVSRGAASSSSLELAESQSCDTCDTVTGP
jgi:hypothetical protein